MKDVSSFFITIGGTACICEAAMEFWGLDDKNGKPTKHMPRPGMKRLQLWQKKEYFDTIIGEFVDQFVMADPDKEAVQQNKTQGLLTGHVHSDHDYAKQDIPHHESDARTNDHTDRVSYKYVCLYTSGAGCSKGL